jgi:hypothetical protein
LLVVKDCKWGRSFAALLLLQISLERNRKHISFPSPTASPSLGGGIREASRMRYGWYAFLHMSCQLEALNECAVRKKNIQKQDKL